MTEGAHLRVSIVICNFNYARFLRPAIDSALGQTHVNTEVVVVDDGSTDGSRDIVRDYGKDVVAHFQENGGLASAVNAGVAVSTGDLVCLLDSDDLCSPTRAERFVAASVAHPAAALLYHQLQTVDGHGRPSGRPWPSRVWSGDIARRLVGTGGWWPRPTTSGLCFSRTFLDRVMPMPTGPAVWPDAYLPPLAAFAGEVHGIPEPLGAYRWHGGNSNAQLFPEEATESGRRSTARRQADQYESEFCRVRSGLQLLGTVPERFGHEANPEYVQALWRSGEDVSASALIRTWMMSEAIPMKMRPRLTAKAAREVWRHSSDRRNK